MSLPKHTDAVEVIVPALTTPIIVRFAGFEVTVPQVPPPTITLYWVPMLGTVVVVLFIPNVAVA